MTGLTVKALRFYHEKSILIPARIEAGTGYRFYAIEQAEEAEVIQKLKDLQFSIRDIADIMAEVSEEAELLDVLEQKRVSIAAQIKRDRQAQRSLTEIIAYIKETRTTMSTTDSEIEQKTVEPMLIAAFRMQAPYKDCGKGFKKLGRAFGMKLAGKPMLLCHDTEYRDIANYETCFPIRSGESKGDIEVRELPGGTCLSIIHRGPYDTISHSYRRLMTYVKEQGVEILAPSREIYIKGPGMIFKGNPKNYLTELQVMISQDL